MKRLFCAPTTLNRELTKLCNAKCRYCDIFWRDEFGVQASALVNHLLCFLGDLRRYMRFTGDARQRVTGLSINLEAPGAG